MKTPARNHIRNYFKNFQNPRFASMPCLLFALACWSDLASGQAQGQASVQSQQNPSLQGVTKIGAFTGFTDRQDADFTYGVQIERQLGQAWSAGAVVEHTANFQRNNDATMVIGIIYYRPEFNPRFSIQGGTGVEFKDIGGDDIMFRTGIGYDIFMNSPFTLTPGIAVNFGESKESVTLGATLKYEF